MNVMRLRNFHRSFITVIRIEFKKKVLTYFKLHVFKQFAFMHHANKSNMCI